MKVGILAVVAGILAAGCLGEAPAKITGPSDAAPSVSAPTTGAPIIGDPVPDDLPYTRVSLPHSFRVPVEGEGLFEASLFFPKTFNTTHLSFHDGKGEHPTGGWGILLVPETELAFPGVCGEVPPSHRLWFSSYESSNVFWTEIPAGFYRLWAWGNAEYLALGFDNPANPSQANETLPIAASNASLTLVSGPVEEQAGARYAATFDLETAGPAEVFARFQTRPHVNPQTAHFTATATGARDQVCASAEQDRSSSVFVVTAVQRLNVRSPEDGPLRFAASYQGTGPSNPFGGAPTATALVLGYSAPAAPEAPTGSRL